MAMRRRVCWSYGTQLQRGVVNVSVGCVRRNGLGGSHWKIPARYKLETTWT